MLETLSKLRELQSFDLQIQEIKERIIRLHSSLKDLRALFVILDKSLHEQKFQLEETRALMREKIVELNTNEERYQQSKSKLSKVSNTKEYNALEKEMDALRKMRARLEEERDSLAEAVEGFEEDVQEKEEKTQKLAKQIKKEAQLVEKEVSSTDERTESLKIKRDRIRIHIPKKIYRRYQFIASRRPGLAVCAAENSVCSGCHMLVQPQIYNELQESRRLIQCPNCQRILYYGGNTAE